MRYSLLLILFYLCFGQYLSAQVNASWHQSDICMLDSLSNLEKSNPIEIQKFFFSHKDFRKKEQLGFSWSSWKRGVYAGYISVYATFFFYKDTVKTYILEARLPNEAELAEEYKSYYLKFLPVLSGDDYQYLYQQENIMSPLAAFDSVKILSTFPPAILKYMSPTSGTYYGYYGGISGRILENRHQFNTIKEGLTQNQLVSIMFSINPASRLTAIEYYLKNKRRFQLPKKIKSWIEIVYTEMPKIQTMQGCIGSWGDSRSLVKQFLTSKFYD